ncbi:MAG: LuxR C-terminal-related transcriptional regulator [Chloroflexota bacterium]
MQHIDHHAMVIPTLADALGIDSANHDLMQQEIITYLQHQQCLIILDNFEHVLEATSAINDILIATTTTKFIVTSRVALRLQSEYLYTLDGLEVPDTNQSNDAIATVDSVQLFIKTAQQVRHDYQPDLARVAKICRIVDGSPLAIKLAAVWAKMLDTEGILQEIERCINFLQTDLRDVPERHRSINAVFNGSWNLLTDDERDVFRRLAIFRDWFTRDAAQAIAGASLPMMMALSDKALLTVNDDGRYRMHTLIQQLVHDKLAEDDDSLHTTQASHGQYFADRITEFAQELRGSRQKEALDAISAVIQDIRAGWFWAVSQAHDDLIQQYIFGMTLYYQMRSRTQDVLELLSLDSAISKALSDETQAQLDLLRGWSLIILLYNSDGVGATWRGIQRLTIENAPSWIGMSLIPAINQPELFAERYESMVDVVRRILERTTDTWQRAWLLKALGEYHFVGGDYEQAVRYLEDSASHFKRINDRWGETWSCGNLGRVYAMTERYREAEDIYDYSIAICEDIGDYNGSIDLLNKKAESALQQGDCQRAESILLDAIQMAHDFRVSEGNITYVLYTLIKLKMTAEEYETAIFYLQHLYHNDYVQRGWRDPEIQSLADKLAQIKPFVADDTYQRATSRGREISIRDIVRDLLSDTVTMPQEDRTASQLIEPLTEREEQILRLITVGLTNRQIAEELTLAIGTVKTHAHHVYTKLGVSNRTEATAVAHDLNLV